MRRAPRRHLQNHSVTLHCLQNTRHLLYPAQVVCYKHCLLHRRESFTLFSPFAGCILLVSSISSLSVPWGTNSSFVMHVKSLIVIRASGCSFSTNKKNRWHLFFLDLGANVDSKSPSNQVPQCPCTPQHMFAESFAITALCVDVLDTTLCRIGA